MLTSFDHIKDIHCRQTFRCSLLSNRSYNVDNINGPNRPLYVYFEGIWNKDCELLSEYCSDEWLVLPEYPIMYGFFQFIYLTNRSINEFKNNVMPDFICFDAKNCPMLLSKIIPIKIIDNLTCCHTLDLPNAYETKHFHDINEFFDETYSACVFIGNVMSCENSSYFYCNQSQKCISYNRVGDGFQDCSFNEDEDFPSCQLNDSNRFRCPSNPDKCLLPVAIGDLLDDCSTNELLESQHGIERKISFPSLCDRIPNDEILQIAENETDETNCHLWPCDNPYSHCNGYWDCLNGIDELYCNKTNCSFNEFQCKNEDLKLTYCLPFNQLFIKPKDNCRWNNYFIELYFHNGTQDLSQYYYSFNKSKCINKDNICISHMKKINLQEDICYQSPDIIVSFLSEVIKIDNDHHTFLCRMNQEVSVKYMENRFMTTLNLGYFPEITSTIPHENISNINEEKEIISRIDPSLAWYCHYGIPLFYGNKNKTKVCLCPPNYYGSRCQWQNQRISLTIQIKTHLNIPLLSIFQFIIMLIDEQGNITSNNYEQILYMPDQKCNSKFNIYLLYPNRPKYLSSNYSIRIDLYNKSRLDYWSSWILPIPYQFLPVNRIATQLMIPKFRQNHLCNLSCGEYGQCIRYINLNNSFFCQCNRGYTGRYCHIKQSCQCPLDSLCISSSICLCPLNKFGTYCYVDRFICQLNNNPCENNGLCIPTDDRINYNGFICICKEGYHGKQCQYKNNLIHINFNYKIRNNNSLLFIHYIKAFDQEIEHQRITILKKILYGYNSITIYVKQSFNIIFIQTFGDNNYYLIVLREIYFLLESSINVNLLPKQHCLSVKNHLNKTFYEYKYLHRIKYYPYLCQQNRELMCFYDEYHLCICDTKRFSNCFLFNHTLKYDCHENNLCYNDGRCFQNNQTCPTTFTCLCSDCYYGNQCQFTTKGFLFSLDPILAYHIKPNISINQQPFIIKFSIFITTILLLFGLILSSLSLITFQSEKTKEIGCGYYLLTSSIGSICMILILKIKFWLLILIQMSTINNKTILLMNCISIEIFLKSLLASTEWINACVSTERLFTVIKDVKFNKKQSQIWSKRIISTIILLTILTHIHDPIKRELIYDIDGDQQRIWCITKYSSQLTTYNTFITLFHFLMPFSINFLSALLLIIIVARKRSNIKHELTYKQHLQSQLKQHKYILIAPVTLILLNLPRLIISFASGYIPQYDHAIVIGGGFGGMITAVYLTKYFSKVTIIESDDVLNDTFIKSTPS
ncbi:hypothetical protein I4U23_011273 [Adineta vaga]|nr:hypothetical protein I4U23_011273 [Adineta vaga]